MFYGFTESESFEDPTILNKYKHHKVIVEKRADGKGYWHIFILKIEDRDIENTIEKISKELKSDWNAMFYNNKIVYAVFKDKIFTLKKELHWQSRDYLQVKQYSKDCGVGDMDFNEAFVHYQNLLSPDENKFSPGEE